MVSNDTSAAAHNSALPAGEYKIVAWDMDLTGRKLIDEFCHIAAYTPEDQFSQYVMPYKNMEMHSVKRHLIKTVTLGRYRMLKDCRTGKFLKTKSEISALLDFLNWLEKVKGSDGAAIILLSYETKSVAPALLLEALKKYQLMDRFSSLVKAFACCYDFTKEKCDQTLKSFSLKIVSQILLNKNDYIYSASNRAKLSYEILVHLTAGENEQEGDTTVTTAVMVEAIRKHCCLIDDELKKIEDLKVLLVRQNTLRPVFAPLMKINNYQRKSALLLRNLIVAALLDYDTLKSLWDEGRDKFQDTITSKVSASATSENQVKELCKVLTEHFDPDSKTDEPNPERETQHSRKNFKRSNNKEKRKRESLENGETVTSSTSASSPAKSNEVDTPQNETPTHEANKTEEAANVEDKSVNENKPSTSKEVENKVQGNVAEASPKHKPTVSSNNVPKDPSKVQKVLPTTQTPTTQSVTKPVASVQNASPTHKTTNRATVAPIQKLVQHSKPTNLVSPTHKTPAVTKDASVQQKVTNQKTTTTNSNSPRDANNVLKKAPNLKTSDPNIDTKTPPANVMKNVPSSNTVNGMNVAKK